MVVTDFLHDPRVRKWLDGVEPDWTLLTFDSLRALRQEPSVSQAVIRIANDLNADEIANSAVARNTFILMRQAIERGGLPLTASGNLSRAVVAEMCKLIEWPHYDQAEAFRLHKVINEPDFLPLHIVRLLAEAAQLVRTQRGRLVVTPLGKSMLSDARQGSLQAILFHLAFWQMDLGYFGRGLLGSWPQADIGIVLWSLSVSAGDGKEYFTFDALNKSRSALNLAKTNDQRQRLLYEGKAVPLKEVQNARAVLDAAENDFRQAEVALEAGHNRLRILGKTDQEITEFQQKGSINPTTAIHAPIRGTVVQRKIGPGQYVGSGASDPVFIIGDVSTVWVVAYVRETEAPSVRVGQAMYFTVLAYPDRALPANISYVATALDPTTRRLMVRATVQNPVGLLKPEMFASVKIFTGEGDAAPAVPHDAIIYEGESAHAWAVRDEGKAIELRRVTIGLTSGNMVEVLSGLTSEDRVITKGSLFIDRVATAAR